MDKNQINQIAENVSDAEQVPDVVFQLTQDCKLLLAEVQRLESRHDVDQKAVYEANQLAETYMKRCQELYDEKNKAEKESLKSRAADMVRSVHEIGVSVIDLESHTWESISKIVKDEKLKYLGTYSTKDLVDELSKREGVSRKDIVPHSSDIGYFEGPAIVLTVID